MTENVKDLIEEVKNLSELMLDLAYSSVLFESKDIAKEVLLLFNNLDSLEERLYLHLFAASRGKFSKRLISIIDIINSSKMVASAARNMSELVLEGAELHPIVKEALQSSEESITREIVSTKSLLKNKSLGEVRLRSKTGINIIAIRRGDKWIFYPNKYTAILENDVLIGVGSSGSCRMLSKLAKGEIKKL